MEMELEQRVTRHETIRRVNYAKGCGEPSIPTWWDNHVERCDKRYTCRMGVM